MKNYLKPYTECTKVKSEGHLLVSTDPSAGHGKIKPGGGNDGTGKDRSNSIDYGTKTTKSYSPNAVVDEFSFNTKNGE
ncbi:hypothetical protein [Prevotella melaninogenica]